MAQAKVKDEVLWLNTLHGRNEVEMGTIVYIGGTKKKPIYSVCWLEGYKSRNDDFGDDCLLGVHDKSQPRVTLGVFSGHTRLTPAGEQWMLMNKLTEEHKEEPVPEVPSTPHTIHSYASLKFLTDGRVVLVTHEGEEVVP